MSHTSYAAASGEKLDEIVRLAELRLEAQLKLGIAADQRAMTMASILAAVDAALIGAAVLLVRDGGVIGWPLTLLIAGFAVAVGLLLWSTMPCSWEVPGSEPGRWVGDIQSGDTLHDGRAAMADYYDDMLNDNHRQLIANANFMRAAFVVLILTLIVSALAALVGF